MLFWQCLMDRWHALCAGGTCKMEKYKWLQLPWNDTFMSNLYKRHAAELFGITLKCRASKCRSRRTDEEVVLLPWILLDCLGFYLIKYKPRGRLLTIGLLFIIVWVCKRSFSLYRGWILKNLVGDMPKKNRCSICRWKHGDGFGSLRDSMFR